MALKLGLSSGDTAHKNTDKRKEKDMDFLKEVLGEELFNQVAEKINAHNGNEANKDNQIKIGNLGKGEYVGKGKYDALQELVNGKETELKSANDLIAELKKSTKGNEELQGKITGYETQVADLQAQLQETERNYAFDLLLMDSGVTDKDEREFLTYKYQSMMKEKGTALELDENKHIKGAEGIVESLKTMRPKAFESAGKDQYQVLGDNRLRGSDNHDSLTKESLLKKPYAERMKIFNENPEAYNAAMKS
ncbi:MAG: phage scaffolding protein [Roseburia sp.]|nr:phage scaffolding protein [Roseburia sp.]MBQ8279555.1 phage scaffolding protein [Roseburia sp.]